MSRSAVRVNRAFLVFGILCILYYLGMGFSVRFGQSLLFLWLLLGLVCIGRFFWWRRAFRQGKPAPLPRGVLIAERCIVCAAIAVFLFAEGFICSGAFQQPPQGLDAVVVLGARVNADGPSGSLRERIEAAADYLTANPETICVCSGGQGEDEPMSEAECMRENLIALGISEERILLEDQSQSTAENIRNSFDILQREAPDVQTVGIVTSDFHVFRALAIARQEGGFTLSGVPARSSVFGFIHYAMREFFTTAVGLVRGDLRFS